MDGRTQYEDPGRKGSQSGAERRTMIRWMASSSFCRSRSEEEESEEGSGKSEWLGWLDWVRKEGNETRGGRSQFGDWAELDYGLGKGTSHEKEEGIFVLWFWFGERESGGRWLMDNVNIYGQWRRRWKN